MKLLIRSAIIIDGTSEFHKKKVDILIINGIIEKIGNSIKAENIDKEINLKDLHVSKGWFDSSVSFGEPGFEERETIENGIRTAALSGYTEICLSGNTDPVLDNNSSITSVLSKAKDLAVRIYPIGALTKRSQGVDLAEMYDMYQAGAVSFSDYKSAVMHPNLLKLALLYAQNFDGLVQSYPQDNDIAGHGLVNEENNSTKLGLRGIPAFAEELQISRDLTILEYTGGKLHIPTISAEKSVKLIKEAKKRGLNVSCSVAIHNLIFTDDVLAEFPTAAKVLPPLRTKKDIKALLKGLKEGTIDMVTSDHAPIDIEHKKVEFENALNGTLGLESSFGALNSILPLEETIDLLTKGRGRFHISEPQIKEGASANLSLFNPLVSFQFQESDIFSTSKNSLFLQRNLKGKSYGIVHRDRIVLVD
ncbi:dihydroorotase [Gillisia sp. Hel_I_29]|uniref:dihydroorotase n=1 Tax=Gillisia sp. Hel_I_29 TaxID=1249975 RepID=UPI000554B071|nr:dihydroorotase [Gillisia sp. Hel_I_29]